MHKDRRYDSLHPYQVHTGPQRDQFVGYVTPFGAKTADRVKTGSVDFSGRFLRSEKWVVTQHNLSYPLTGLPEGPNSRLRHGSLLRLIPFQQKTDVIFPFRLRFSSPRSAGFELTRSAGIRSRFTVAIHDPAVDRLLTLACVAQFALFAENVTDPRKTVIDYTTFGIDLD